MLGENEDTCHNRETFPYASRKILSFGFSYEGCFAQEHQDKGSWMRMKAVDGVWVEKPEAAPWCGY